MLNIRKWKASSPQNEYGWEHPSNHCQVRPIANARNLVTLQKFLNEISRILNYDY